MRENSSPTFCSIRFVRRAARLASFELGRPRGNLGAPAARRLRSWATAERTALFTSCRTWNWQT